MVLVIPAGGGLVWDRAHVLVVHRPRYDDWTLPKGKLDDTDGGDVAACAVREVLEETGAVVELGRPAGQTRYRVGGPGGEPAVKVVDYWHMARTGGNFTPNREVDEVRWLPAAEARMLLTYARDRMLVDGASPGRTPERGVLRRYEAAVAEGDLDGLEAVLGDDFVAVTPEGERLARDAFLAAAASVFAAARAPDALGLPDPVLSQVRNGRIKELHLRE